MLVKSLQKDKADTSLIGAIWQLEKLQGLYNLICQTYIYQHKFQFNYSTCISAYENSSPKFDLKK